MSESVSLKRPRTKQLKDEQEYKETEEQKDIASDNEEHRPRKKRKLNDDENKEQNSEIVKKLKTKHQSLLDDGYKCVVGVDEAGRGPLAGPVVVAAAYVPIHVCIEGITDSKKINLEAEREKLYEQIIATKDIKYSTTILDHDVIDEHNILEASLMGMRQCVQKLHDALVADVELGVDYALADGNRDPRMEYPPNIKYEYIVKGDGSVYCIGAASIIAKVTRDRIMNEYDEQYPEYKFKQHKGYPTPFHKQLVLSKGPCDIHRKTFRPVKDWYKKHKPDVIEAVEALKKKRAAERQKQKKAKKQSKQKQTKGTKSIANFFAKVKSKSDKLAED